MSRLHVARLRYNWRMLNALNSSRSLEKKFSKVFRDNLFHGSESLSGRGSDLDQTLIIEQEIPIALNDFQIKSVLDVPCGDQNWISRIDFKAIEYIGADIVPSLIKRNNDSFGSQLRKFIELDLTRSVPPKSDLILCRDLFVHLSTKSIKACLSNIRASGSTYLLTTTFTDYRSYKNLPFFSRNVGWRPINFQLNPFNFSEPLRIINEGCTEGDGKFGDKSLALWKIDEL
jgi:hypothetical protein